MLLIPLDWSYKIVQIQFSSHLIGYSSRDSYQQLTITWRGFSALFVTGSGTEKREGKQLLDPELPSDYYLAIISYFSHVPLESD